MSLIHVAWGHRPVLLNRDRLLQKLRCRHSSAVAKFHQLHRIAHIG